MPQDNFSQQKQDVLLRIDKSSKRSWDKKIAGLCEKINKKENYYTTSSCSGRVVLIIESDKKEHGLFVQVYHDLISLKQLKEDLNKIASFHSVINNKQLIKNPDITNYLAEKSDKVDFGAIKSRAKRDELIKFKQEPCILHISCKTLEDAEKLIKKSQLAGWKKAGIVALGKRLIVELNSTEKLEFPIISNEKILVNEDFLKIIIKKSNKNLKKSWEKIERLKKSL